MSLPIMDIPERNQDAILWRRSGTDEFGQEVYDGAEPIKCRWDDVHEQYVSLAGTTTVSRSKVLPDRDLREGDVLWLGKLEDFNEDWDKPKNDPRAFEIMKVERIPNYDQDEQEIIAMM